MDVKIEESWHRVLSEEFEKPYFQNLTEKVRQEYGSQKIFPRGGQIFAAFEATPFDKVKVVILGQDPYHGEGQAHGLCFSVPEGIALPPSLLNIYKELHDDIGTPLRNTGDLTSWARQGVLLLNSTLTVRANQAGSHQGMGWEEFTDAVIRHLATEQSGIAFILWGAYAIKKGSFIDRSKHLVLTSAHPSPLSAYRGFFGSRPFSKVNEYLKSQGKSPIEW